MAGSSIEWTEHTWNPITGCTKVSPGCKNCYALRMAIRLQAMGKPQYQNAVKDGQWTGMISFAEKALEIPLRRKKATVYFVDSMSDLFHADVKIDWLDAIWSVMERTPYHTYQILSKRAHLLQHRVDVMVEKYGILPNVWLGISIENSDYLNRIEFLRFTSAHIRFLSLEPLLGPIDLHPFLWEKAGPLWAGENPSPGIDWVIVGGESGPGARPMHPNWVRSLRDECAEAGVKFFFKQWGEWAPVFNSYTSENGYDMVKMGKREAGRRLDGRRWSEMPQLEAA